MVLFNLQQYLQYSTEAIIFPQYLFIIILIIIGLFLYLYKKKSFLQSFLIGTYISFLICTLFFPIAINVDTSYFQEDLSFLVRSTSLLGILSHFQHQSLFCIFHLIAFLPLGYILTQAIGYQRSFYLGVAIILSVEVIQVLIDFITQYLQFTFSIEEIILHLLGFCIGMLIYKPVNTLSLHFKNMIQQKR